MMGKSSLPGSRESQCIFGRQAWGEITWSIVISSWDIGSSPSSIPHSALAFPFYLAFTGTWLQRRPEDNQATLLPSLQTPAAFQDGDFWLSMMLSEYLTGTVAVLSVPLDLRWQGHGKLWLACLLLVSGCHWLPLCPYLNFREISKKVIRLIVFNFGQVVWVLAAISFKDGMPASANSSSWFLFHGFSDGSGSWSKSVQSLFNAGPFLVPFLYLLLLHSQDALHLPAYLFPAGLEAPCKQSSAHFIQCRFLTLSTWINEWMQFIKAQGKIY